MKAHLIPMLSLVVNSHFIAAIPPPARPNESYRQATIDEQARLHFFTTDGREIIPSLEKDQVGFQMPAISRNKKTVGWLALYPNCCTSYPIPLELVIYRGGRVIRRFRGIGMPVWKWRYRAGDRQVIYEQEPTHGGIGVYFERRSLRTGRLLEFYDGDPEPGAPMWVHEVSLYEPPAASAPASKEVKR